jgi:radical SAM family uncharacterized protein
MIPESLLASVAAPARYVGGEWNAVVKDGADALVRFALCYPDAYEIGMSHLGSRILYHAANLRDDTWCERVFYPWPDAVEVLRGKGIALCTLESGTPLSAMDIVGFTLQHELTYTTILATLELGGIGLLAEERGENEPIVIAGGPCAYNPEPLADFIDAFAIGDGEDVIGEICAAVAACKQRGDDRKTTLEALSQLDGLYVPSIHDPQSAHIRKRVVLDFDAAPFPEAPIVPYLEIVHDRLQAEIARGCTRGCRFCQAGMIYRPVRERRLETLLRQIECGIANTGWDEASLISLSCIDYSRIEELVDGIHDRLADQRVSVSLPSLRTDAFSVNLARKVQRVKKSGLTFAPEAGTQSMRDRINKQVSDEDLRTAAEAAFASGWQTLKLYFMIGLPGETDEDVLGIAQMAEAVAQIGRSHLGNRAGRLKVNVSVACFVPKAHTPFQWARQDTAEELIRKQALLRGAIHARAIHLSCHDTRRSLLEGVLARGGRDLGPVILSAYRAGCVLDAWDEQFDFARWEAAFAGHGRSLQAEASRDWDEGAPLPWRHIDCGVSEAFLRREARLARESRVTPDCREGKCVACGVRAIAGECPERPGCPPDGSDQSR